MFPPSGDIPARSAEIEQFIDQFLTTVCNGSRRHILECLSLPTQEDTTLPERSVGEIANHLGLAISTTSEHLKELQQLHLLTTRKDGKRIFYSLRNRELVKTFQEMIGSLEDHYHRGILPPANVEDIS